MTLPTGGLKAVTAAIELGGWRALRFVFRVRSSQHMAAEPTAPCHVRVSSTKAAYGPADGADGEMCHSSEIAATAALRWGLSRRLVER
jgi:hypothetical protein